ncbi:MAG: M48 family metalloprotease [Planctomycetota bacterium]|nr:hypothetical protein [Planctomycetaceae bacterium]MDQ3330489.1 M48 family metalloprotease [Planctomycetota bacterium]
MTTPSEFNAFLERLASDAGLKLSLALVHFLWQGVLIAALAAVLMRLVGRRSPQRRYLIGVVAMALMAVAPVATFCLVEPPDWSSLVLEDEPAFDFSSMASAELELLLATLETGSDIAPDVPSGVPAKPLTWPERVRLYQPYALMLWLFGTGLCALRLGVGLEASWRFGRRRRTLPVAWQASSARVAARLGVKAPRIFVSDRIVEAVAVGLLKPMVLLPAAWVGSVPIDVLEAVLAHEIAHLRRYDLWVNLLQRCIEAALFYHPAVWWLSRRIRVEREYCCDEMAATTVSGRAAYARALEFVAKERVASARRPTLAAALAAGMGGSRMALLDRVRRVLGSDVKSNRGTWLSEGLLALAVPAALWAGIATVAPAVATADDDALMKQNEKASSTDAHIGDIEYWQERGVEPGMLVVLEGGVNGSPVDLATGEPVHDPQVKFLGNLTVHPAPVPDLLNFRVDGGNLQVGDVKPAGSLPSPAGNSDVTAALRELREEMNSLRKELDAVRKDDIQKRLKAVLESQKQSERTKAALERRISIQLNEVPLEEAIRKFRDEADVNFVIDKAGLEEEGVTPETPVSLELNAVPIHAALNTLLSPLNLGATVKDGVVTITSRLRTQGPMEVQTYPVGDLMIPLPVIFGKGRDFETGPTGRGPAFERLIELITGTIEPGSWETVGGNGVIRANESTLSLVVRQTRQVHDQILDLLDHLRRHQGEKAERERQEAISRMQEAERIGAAWPINRTHKTPLKPTMESSQMKRPALPTKAPEEPSQPAAPLPETANVETADRLLRVVPLEIDGKQIEVIVEELREGQGPAKEIQLRVLSPAEKAELDSKMWVKEKEVNRDEQTRTLRERLEKLEQEMKDDEAAREASRNADKRFRELQAALAKYPEDHPIIAELKKAHEAERQADREKLLEISRQRYPSMSLTLLEKGIENLVVGRDRSEAAETARREAEIAQKHAEKFQRQLEEQMKVIEQLRNELQRARSNPSPPPYQRENAPQPGDGGEPAEEALPTESNEKSDQAAPNDESDEATESEKDRLSTAPNPFVVRFKSPMASAEMSQTFPFYVGFVR